MLQVLSNRNYRILFSAQLVALLGTGLLTIALGLTAYDLAKSSAGEVLATALAIKMLVYITVSPVAEAILDKTNKKKVLIFSDLVRCIAALCIPFITAEWQIYLLIFILQGASATFTPTFQSLIPTILPDEKDYTNALSLSRLAYDIENIISPLIAGILLAIVSFNWLFVGTAIGFILSSLLILFVSLPIIQSRKKSSFLRRITLGSRIYLTTPRLRGLLSLNFVAACFGAMVIVNSVIIVKSVFAGTETDLAIALGIFGLGSMIAALSLPGLLQHYTDRYLMLSAAMSLFILQAIYGYYFLYQKGASWNGLLIVWFLGGIAYSLIQTPSGRLLKRSSDEAIRPALFAAQFSLSHLCWLVTYPLAGYLGSAYGIGTTFLIMSGLSLTAIIIARLLWVKTPKSHLENEQ